MRKFLFLLLLPIAALAAPVNTDYGRVSPSNTVEYAPAQLRIGNIVDGRVFANNATALHPTAAQYASQGWLPVSTNIPPCDVDGFENVGTGYWFATNGVVVQRYRMSPLPPAVHTYRKSYLAQWLYAEGYWAAFKELLAQSEDAAFFWETSTEFDSNHPQWPAIYGGIKAALRIPDEDAEEWLWYGEHGPGGR